MNEHLMDEIRVLAPEGFVSFQMPEHTQKVFIDVLMRNGSKKCFKIILDNVKGVTVEEVSA